MVERLSRWVSLAWAPIGAEQTATGYEIALKNAGTGQYTIWITDSSGNVTYDPIGVVSGNSAALETLKRASIRISTATG